MRARLAGVLGAQASDHPQLRLLWRHLTADQSPQSVLRWIATMSPSVKAVLRSAARGARLEEAQLAHLAAEPGGAALLKSCRRAGVFAPRLELARVEALLERFASVGPRWAALLVRRFWQFHLGRLAGIRHYRRALDPKLTHDRYLLGIVWDFLVYVHARGEGLRTLMQDVVDRYLTERPASHGKELARFFRWTSAVGETSALSTPGHSLADAGRALTRAEYDHALRRALIDETLRLPVRVAVLLVGLTAHTMREVLVLRRRDLRALGAGAIRVQFARGVPQELDGAPARLIRQWCAATEGRWLFPSPRYRERPLTTAAVRRMLARMSLCLHLGQLRNAALRELTSALGAAEASVVVGIGWKTAKRWADGALDPDRVRYARSLKAP